MRAHECLNLADAAVRKLTGDVCPLCAFNAMITTGFIEAGQMGDARLGEIRIFDLVHQEWVGHRLMHRFCKRCGFMSSHELGSLLSTPPPPEGTP